MCVLSGSTILRRVLEYIMLKDHTKSWISLCHEKSGSSYRNKANSSIEFRKVYFSRQLCGYFLRNTLSTGHSSDFSNCRSAALGRIVYSQQLQILFLWLIKFLICLSGSQCSKRRLLMKK